MSFLRRMWKTLERWIDEARMCRSRPVVGLPPTWTKIQSAGACIQWLGYKSRRGKLTVRLPKGAYTVKITTHRETTVSRSPETELFHVDGDREIPEGTFLQPGECFLDFGEVTFRGVEKNSRIAVTLVFLGKLPETK